MCHYNYKIQQNIVVVKDPNVFKMALEPMQIFLDLVFFSLSLIQQFRLGNGRRYTDGQRLFREVECFRKLHNKGRLSSYQVLVLKGTLEPISVTPFILEMSKLRPRGLNDYTPKYRSLAPSEASMLSIILNSFLCRLRMPILALPLVCWLSPVKLLNLFPEPFREGALPKKFDSAIHLSGEFDPAVTRRGETLFPSTCQFPRESMALLIYFIYCVLCCLKITETTV